MLGKELCGAKTAGVSVAALLLLVGVAHAAVLENPAPGSIQSGIGVVSGWKCQATRIEVIFDNGAPIQVGYGTSRGDTRQGCGDDNNGFGLLWNWNLLGPGRHTVRVLDNGVEFARATFTVVSTGEEFLTGLSGEAVAPGFPDASVDTTLVWQESLQNFVITGSQPRIPGSVCELFFVDALSDDGRFIALDDGSVWEVAPVDRLDVVREWELGDDVSLCALGETPRGTRIMVNLFLGSGIRVTPRG
ncbi:MAG: hypothetical protein NZ578_02860 [Candidatus Binatia bacterium]|nr:hypothetical protein [Candidatus Binatia bacterium]